MGEPPGCAAGRAITLNGALNSTDAAPSESATSGKPSMEPKAGVSAWWMLAVLLAFYTISFVDRHLLSLLIDDIKGSLRLTEFQMGLIVGPAFGVSYALFGLPLGWAADRWSRRWVIAIGAIFWSLATIACGLATSFGTLFFARALVGIGEAALTPAAYSLIADKFPPRQLGTALSIYSMGPKMGNAAAFWIGAIVIAASASMVVSGQISDLEPWQLAFFFVGSPGLIFAALAFSFKEPQRLRARFSEPEDDAQTLWPFVKAHRKLFGSMFAGFGCMAILGGSLAWIPAFISRNYGLTTSEYAPALGVVSAVAGLSLLLNGMIVDWLLRRGLRDAYIRFYTWLLILIAPVMAGAYFLPWPPAFYVAYGLMQAIALPYMLYAAATIQMVTPNHLRARVSAMFLFVVTATSSGIGPPLVAGITDFVLDDPDRLGVSMAIVGTLSCVAAWMFLRKTLRALKPILQRIDEAIARNEQMTATSKPSANV